MAETLLDQALALPESERAALARQLLLSLEPDQYDDDCAAAWATEIEARIAKVESGNFVAKDWREAMMEMRQTLAARKKS